MKSVHYQANGEASDWIMETYGIIVMSPELGLPDQRTRKFFIKDKTLLKEIIVTNAMWIGNLFKLMIPRITVGEAKIGGVK